MQSFTSQIFGVAGSLEQNFDFFSPFGFNVQTNSDHKTQKIKLYSVRALKRYLNKTNLIHGGVMATTSKFPHQDEILNILWNMSIFPVFNTQIFSH